MWLNACPRCGGDLYLRDAIDTSEYVCFQCSRVYYQRPEQRSEDTRKVPRRRKAA